MSSNAVLGRTPRRALPTPESLTRPRSSTFPAVPSYPLEGDILRRLSESYPLPVAASELPRREHVAYDATVRDLVDRDLIREDTGDDIRGPVQGYAITAPGLDYLEGDGGPIAILQAGALVVVVLAVLVVW